MAANIYFKNGPFSRKWVQYAFSGNKPNDNDSGQSKTTVEKSERKNVGSTDQDVWTRSDPDGYAGCYAKPWDHHSNYGHDMEVSV